MSKRTTYTAAKKVEILREIMEGGMKVSDASRKYDITVPVILQWKKRLFEGAVETFSAPVGRKPGDKQDKEVALLQRKLQNREIAITGLAMELMELKKNINGEM
jgi:transposase-like protein